ncbi:hypothetical protein JOC75_002956 [Metabacillus crassostreae]|nr:hypothetical protein [Metabacillus crassostreae]MBM7604952.1 hypothetical protein [Metabacillus crassostreae]
MSDWNEQAAPNNNLPVKNLRAINGRLNKESSFKSSSSKQRSQQKD